MEDFRQNSDSMALSSYQKLLQRSDGEFKCIILRASDQLTFVW